MKFFLKSFNEYKKDYFLLSLLVLIFVFLCSLFFARQSNPIIDVGSEAYIPLQMLKGKILYKDTYFCGDYAQEICRFIFENYEYQTEFGKEFLIKIYKKK